tara:strand:+ start:581 stop:793 length:213 start_codon:yes stop_codon:yes gene_type:complete
MKKAPAKMKKKSTMTMKKKSAMPMKKAPMKKALKGGQSRLPVELQKEILASPGKMLKASAMKMYGKMMKK